MDSHEKMAQIGLSTIEGFKHYYNNKMMCLAVLEIMTEDTPKEVLESDRNDILKELFQVKINLRQQLDETPDYLVSYTKELSELNELVKKVYDEVENYQYNPASGVAVMNALAKIIHDEV